MVNDLVILLGIIVAVMFWVDFTSRPQGRERTMDDEE